MIEYLDQPYLRKWLLDMNNIEYTNGLVCLGNKDSNGYIRGVVAYDHWTGKSCEMHVVGNKYWLSRSFMWAAFDYPFNQAKCEVIFAKISTGKKSVVNLALKLGFNLVCTIPDVFPDGGENILSMYKSQCKWLEIYNDQFAKGTASA